MKMSLKEKRGELLKQVAEYQARIKAGETLTDEETEAVQGILADIEGLDAQVKKMDEKKDVLSRLMTVEGDTPADPAAPADSEGEKSGSVGQQAVEVIRKSGGLAAIRGKEIHVKASTDTQAVGTGWQDMVTDVDRQPVMPWQRQLTIAGLMSTRIVQGSSIEYFLMSQMEGAVGAVAEGGAKPQVHYKDPTPIRESLRKIAGHIVVTDEMKEDLSFIVQLIDGDLRNRLQIEEERQLLAGDGAGNNLRGLLNREGVQVVKATAANFADKLAEAKFAVSTATNGGAQADAIVMHPDDYLALLLTKDGNQQYYGGGFFQNAYGNGAFAGNPAVWLLPTVTTPAIAKGTALVGAFKTAKVLRKGGIRRKDGWIDQQFIHNASTIVLEERVGLMVDRPEAFVKVTVGAGA